MAVAQSGGRRLAEAGVPDGGGTLLVKWWGKGTGCKMVGVGYLCLVPHHPMVQWVMGYQA